MRAIPICEDCYGPEILEDYPRDAPMVQTCFFCGEKKMCIVIVILDRR